MSTSGERSNLFKFTVTNLIDSSDLVPVQLSFLVDCVFFKEKADLVSRCKKVIIADMVVVPGGKLGL